MGWVLTYIYDNDFHIQRKTWLCSLVQHMWYNMWSVSLHIFLILLYIGLIKKTLIHERIYWWPWIKYVTSHNPNHYQDLASKWNPKFCFCLFLDLFACFPFNARKSIWGTLLILRHVFNNPFHGHDLKLSGLVSRSMCHIWYLLLNLEKLYEKMLLNIFKLFPSTQRDIMPHSSTR